MKRHLEYISLLNIMACFAVVMLHVNSCFWTFSQDRYWLTANIIESVMYFAVPIFFMNTGATLIDYHKRYSTKNYIKKRVLKTVIPFCVWSIIGLFYVMWRHPDIIANKTLWQIIDMLLNTEIIEIYWFFVPLFSIYLSIPILSLIPEDKRQKGFSYLAVFSFLTVSLLPFLCFLIGIEYNNSLILSVGAGYIIYVVLGYLISHYEIQKEKRVIIYIFAIIGLLLHMVGTYCLSIKNNMIIETFKGYLNLPTVLYSTGIYVFFKYIKISEKLKPIFKLNQYTFGIYLLHYYIIDFVTNRFSINTYSILYRLLGPFAIIFVCIIIIKIIRKIPIIRNIIP